MTARTPARDDKLEPNGPAEQRPLVATSKTPPDEVNRRDEVLNYSCMGRTDLPISFRDQMLQLSRLG
jgi:hypothetical protein